MEIDRTAPAIAEGEIQIDAPPEVVFGVLSDLSGWPSWNSDVRSISVAGGVQPGTAFRWKAGGATMSSRLETVTPPSEIGWTGKAMGIDAVHVFQLEARDRGTLARSQESFRGLIPSVLKSYSRKLLQRGIDTILSALKTEAERRAASSPGSP
jgi:uncharacterized protein YndB with AHSA1/START domain